MDPELNGVAFLAPWPRGLMLPLTLTGVHILTARVGWTIFAALVPPMSLWGKVLPFVGPRHRRRVAWEARGLLLVHGVLLTLGAVVLPEVLWLYGGVLVGHALMAVYVTCEHRGLPQEGGVLNRTRSIQTIAPVRWLLWNMPFHAEHHGWPAVPWYALPDLHEQVADHLPHRSRGFLALYRSRGQA